MQCWDSPTYAVAHAVFSVSNDVVHPAPNVGGLGLAREVVAEKFLPSRSYGAEYSSEWKVCYQGGGFRVY
jgi:hypothetical protein